jgi:hypothetical protein
VTDIAWAAQLRLHAKFKRLVARRVMKTKAVVAVARELAGFVWAIGREVQTSGWQGIAIEPVAAAAAMHSVSPGTERMKPVGRCTHPPHPFPPAGRGALTTVEDQAH